MLALIPALLVASVPAPETACEVGKVAIVDLLKPRGNDADHYYGKSVPDKGDLFDQCPRLREMLPAGYSYADSEAWRRATAARNEHSRRPAYIHSIGVPKISPDGNTATVEFVTICGAACAGGEQAVYNLSDGKWVRDSGPVTVWVT